MTTETKPTKKVFNLIGEYHICPSTVKSLSESRGFLQIIVSFFWIIRMAEKRRSTEGY